MWKKKTNIADVSEEEEAKRSLQREKREEEEEKTLTEEKQNLRRDKTPRGGGKPKGKKEKDEKASCSLNRGG